jgi:hypothetical protein
MLGTVDMDILFSEPKNRGSLEPLHQFTKTYRQVFQQVIYKNGLAISVLGCRLKALLSRDFFGLCISHDQAKPTCNQASIQAERSSHQSRTKQTTHSPVIPPQSKLI